MPQPLLHRMRARIVEAPAPKATAEEGQKAFPYAVEMILYIACLHSFLYNLQSEMEDIGEYRHAKKRWLNQAIGNIGSLHQALHKNLGSYSEVFGLWYNPQQVIPQWQKDMARWAMRREIYASCDFEDYEPRKGFKCSEYFNNL